MENLPAAKAGWGRRLLRWALLSLVGLVEFAAIMLLLLRFELIPAMALMFGFWALIAGEFRVGTRRSVLGARARVLGAAWILWGWASDALNWPEKIDPATLPRHLVVPVVVMDCVAFVILLVVTLLLSKRIEEPPKSKAPPSLPSAPLTSLTLENPNRL